MPEQRYICLDFKVYYYNLNTIVGSTVSLIVSLKSVCITGNTELSMPTFGIQNSTRKKGGTATALKSSLQDEQDLKPLGFEFITAG